MNIWMIPFTIGMTMLLFYLAIKARKSNHPKAEEAEKRFLFFGYVSILGIITSILDTAEEFIRSIGGGL